MATHVRQIATIGGVAVFLDSDGFLSFTSCLHVDADGASRAYHPQPGKGLDFLGNAGVPGNWWALACDKNGQPYIQGAHHPAPGYYVSTTALQNPNYPSSDPARYVDSEKVPYVVLPSNWNALTGVKTPLGTKCIVKNLENGKECEAKFADVGPRNKLGEGSIALARALGIPNSPKTGGTDKPIILYRISQTV